MASQVETKLIFRGQPRRTAGILQRSDPWVYCFQSWASPPNLLDDHPAIGMLLKITHNSGLMSSLSVELTGMQRFGHLSEVR